MSLFEPCRQFCCLLLWFFSSSFRKNFSITFFQIIQIPQMQDYTEKEPRWLKMEKIYKWIIWKLQVNPLTVMKLLFKRMDGFRRLTFKKIQTWFFFPSCFTCRSWTYISIDWSKNANKFQVKSKSFHFTSSGQHKRTPNKLKKLYMSKKTKKKCLFLLFRSVRQIIEFFATVDHIPLGAKSTVILTLALWIE